MGEFCTCGTELVDGALFCHKCGRPTRELPSVEPVAPEPPPTPVAIAAPPPRREQEPGEIGLHNRVAVRTALLVALISTVLVNLPFGGMLQFLWMMVLLPAVGFLTVYLYHRRTGEFLTPKAGARLGGMTGLFCFLVALVLLTVSAILMAGRGGLPAVLREQMNSEQVADPVMEQVLRLMESPSVFAMTLLFTVTFLLVFYTVLTAAGGALGAKVLERD